MTKPVVYFVRIGKHVKIGFSSNIAERLKSFQTSAVEVDLLIVVPGDRSLEGRLHELLREARITREIFHHDWRVQGFIDNVKYDGLERGLKYLKDTTPRRREEAKREARETRVRAARIGKAEKDAYFASLVAERKQKLGW